MEAAGTAREVPAAVVQQAAEVMEQGETDVAHLAEEE
jgi:hypothetical protein